MTEAGLQGGDWTGFKGKYSVKDDDGKADKCCIHLPLKKPLFKDGPLYTFMCVYMTQEMKDLGKECEPIAMSWGM